MKKLLLLFAIFCVVSAMHKITLSPLPEKVRQVV